MLSGTTHSDLSDIGAISGAHQTRMRKIMSIGWLGQTVASLCWILSVFAYGIRTTGDWLQLFAASSWMMSNIATIFSIE